MPRRSPHRHPRRHRGHGQVEGVDHLCPVLLHAVGMSSEWNVCLGAEQTLSELQVSVSLQAIEEPDCAVGAPRSVCSSNRERRREGLSLEPSVGAAERTQAGRRLRCRRMGSMRGAKRGTHSSREWEEPDQRVTKTWQYANTNCACNKWRSFALIQQCKPACR